MPKKKVYPNVKLQVIINNRNTINWQTFLTTNANIKTLFPSHNWN